MGHAIRVTKRVNPETVIQNAIRDLLRMDGWLVIRHQQNLGSYLGLTDLSAVKDGKTIYIEVKTPTGRQSAYQKQFQKDIEEHGATYILARSVDDIKPYLTSTQMLF